MAKPQKVYWDSCTVIDWLQGTNDERVKRIEPVIRAAKEGHVLIVTSAFTIAEVVRAKGNPEPLPESDEQKIVDFFKQAYIEVRNLDRRISGEVRTNCRHCLPTGKRMKVADSIHVTTAAVLKVPSLHTFDEKTLHPFSREFGDPPVVIDFPSYTPIKEAEPVATNETDQMKLGFSDKEEADEIEAEHGSNDEVATPELDGDDTQSAGSPEFGSDSQPAEEKAVTGKTKKSKK